MLALALVLSTHRPSLARAANNCDYTLGFKALHDLIPSVVGDCLVNEHHNADNGDGLQETTGGLLVWRKADNWTAFTDGYRTWINGPNGLQERLNTERFPWEHDTPAAQHAGPLSAYPNPSITPGATSPAVTQANIGITICKRGYTATIRPPVSVTEPIKFAQIRQYGFVDTRASHYEEDHFVPLELGGSPNDPRNLWPEHFAEPYGAHDKDQVEDYLNRQVCDGSMTLATAQQTIETDWAAVFQKLSIVP